LSAPRVGGDDRIRFSMSTTPPIIRSAAVLGAGVMGAQIAAHLVNCGVPVLLFDLPASEGPPSAIAERAIAGLGKLEPAPLAAKDRVAYIEPADYAHDLARLAECDLMIEAIAERLDWKRELYSRIAPHVASHAMLATNTSGLSLAALADALPPALRSRFCGVHFFNPPRYMHLVELIGAPSSDPAMLDGLETFLTTTLGKGVLRAHDTPNFIANRIGVFSILATMIHTERLGLGFDVVDALTGPAIGRPKSASFRTVDVVGLDTTAHVIGTMRDGLRDDPWHRHFEVPKTLDALISKGALGQKSGAGFYRKQGRDILVLDPQSGQYRASAGEVAPEVAQILALRDAKEKLAALRNARHPQAAFLWAIFRDVFHYCAYHLEAIADNARDVDLALRWGFGWDRGPFETWQAAGWREVADWIAEDIAAGRALSDAPLPGWIASAQVAQAGGVHTARGSYAPAADAFHGRSTLPVYERQPYPDACLGERFDTGTTVFETDAVRMWQVADDIAIVSFKTKRNTISEAVLDGVLRACDEAERRFAGLVLWQGREPFSLGADLAAISPAIKAGQWSAIEAVVAKFQQAALRLRYCFVPTVAAVRGMALGGSCEFILHCDCTVAALESYIGLVEAGVGLLPAGGGSKELAVRAADESRRGAVGSRIDMLPQVRAYFQGVAMATVAKSALEAKELGYLAPADIVVAHPHEILHVAKRAARALAESGYRPPLPRRDVPVAGRTGIATLKLMLVNLRDGGFISAYDYEIGSRIAAVMCGGDVDSGSLVDERWLLELERAEFMALLRDERTQARIAHTLATGKPLRN
jgi:3-hydroxyacyl-CoA dehydrogenase